MFIYPASFPPEESFTQVCEIPRRKQPNENPTDIGLPAMPSGSLTSQRQDGRDDRNQPAEPVGTPPELVAGEEPMVMVKQSPAEEDNTQMDVTNKLDRTNKTDMANEKEPDMTSETDVEKDPVEVLQDAEPNHTQASETSEKESGSETGRNPPESPRRSERS